MLEEILQHTSKFLEDPNPSFLGLGDRDIEDLGGFGDA